MGGLILSIETSSPCSSAAISEPDRVLAEATFTMASEGGRRLPPAIRRMMDDLGLGFRDFSAIACSQGPGSFTGLRIGLSLAKTLALANGIPLYAAGSLLLVAYNACRSSDDIYPLLDARRGEVYAAGYRFGGNRFIETMCPTVIAPEVLAPLLPDRAVLVGEGAIRYQGVFLESGPRVRTIAPLSLALPLAFRLAELVHRGFLSEYVGDVMAIEPLYIRRPEAELRWKGER